ncbi:elongation factor 1-beta-like protein, partial [Tanacetum coccineum]
LAMKDAKVKWWFLGRQWRKEKRRALSYKFDLSLADQLDGDEYKHKKYQQTVVTEEVVEKHVADRSRLNGKNFGRQLLVSICNNGNMTALLLGAPPQPLSDSEIQTDVSLLQKPKISVDQASRDENESNSEIEDIMKSSEGTSAEIKQRFHVIIIVETFCHVATMFALKPVMPLRFRDQASNVNVRSTLPTAGRSSIVVDVKPWEDETDMQKIEEAIRSVQREGFTWSAWRDSIAFVGIIFKLGEMKGSF